MKKVNNKKAIKHLADQSRKTTKGRSIIAIFAIALTSLLFTTVFVIGGNILKKSQEETMRQVGGSSHAGFKYLTEEEYDRVKADKKIASVSARRLVGSVVDEPKLAKLNVEVNCFEAANAKATFCYPETGKMPEAEDDIVLSSLVLDKLEVPARLGEKIPLCIDIDGKKIKKTFTLCGYYEGDPIFMAQMAEVSEKFADHFAPTPTDSMTAQKLIQNPMYAGRIMADFNFHIPLQLEKQTKALAKRCKLSDDDALIGINWAYMDFKIDPVTIATLLCILFVIISTGCLIIYNIFYINVYHDIQFYGLLKTIGTTGRQLKKIVHRQAYMLSIPGILIGLFIGAFVGSALLPIIMGQFSVVSQGMKKTAEFPLWIFVISAVFSFITVLLSCIKPCRIASKVSPIEALRYNEYNLGSLKKKKSKKTKKVTPFAMGRENLKRSRGKVIIVVLSLSLSLILLNSIYSIIKSFDIDEFISNMTVSDFYVHDASLNNVSVMEWNTEGVTEDFMQELEKRPEITQKAAVYLKEYVTVPISDENFQQISKKVFHTDAAKKALQFFADRYGQSYSDYISYIEKEKSIDGKIFGMGDMLLQKLDHVQGEIDMKKWASGNYLIATYFGDIQEGGGIPFFEPGERVQLTNDAGVEKSYEVLATVDIPYSVGIQRFGEFDCNFILPETEFLSFIGEQAPMSVHFDVDQEKEEKVGKWLDNYCETVNPDLKYTSKQSIVDQFNSVIKMYSLVGGLLVFIIAVIGIFNFINTTITTMLSQKKELAMMQAVGMTGKQLKNMLMSEGACYAILTAIVSFVGSILVSVFALKKLGSELTFFFHWSFHIMPVLIGIVVLFIVSIVIPVLAYRVLCQESLVERMKNDE